MNVSTVAPVIISSDHAAAVNRLTALLGGPIAEFPVPTAPLTVTVFPGVTLLSGAQDAVSPVRDLRATFFVDSLTDIATLLTRLGWSMSGSLGASSLLARDPDGNLLEFVERGDAP
jgi:hypothetical protein